VGIRTDALLALRELGIRTGALAGASYEKNLLESANVVNNYPFCVQNILFSFPPKKSLTACLLFTDMEKHPKIDFFFN
jgi:hypothetical protein